MHNVTVGQKLWFEPHLAWLGQPREVTVTKVGRVWAEVDVGSRSFRISKETLVVDAGSNAYPGRCYLDRREWERLAEAQRLSGAIIQRIRSPSANGLDRLSLEDLRQIASILGVEA